MSFTPLYLAVPLFCCVCIEYLRYARYSGPVEGDGVRVARKTMLVFTWKFAALDFSQSFDVHLRCENAARHGVRLPKSWKNQLNSGCGLPVVDDLADAAIRRVREELGLSDMVKLDCRPRCVHTRARFLACALSRACTCVQTLVCVRVLIIANLNRYAGDGGAALTLRSSLTFRWAIVMNDQIHESEVCVRADNALERGVPFPAAWRKELNIDSAQPAVDVDALARSAVRRAREEHSLSEAAHLDCRPSLARIDVFNQSTHTLAVL